MKSIWFWDDNDDNDAKCSDDDDDIEWDSTAAHGQVYSVTDDADLPLAGMNTNACEYTSCPIQASDKKTYNYTLPLQKKFPVVSICPHDVYFVEGCQNVTRAYMPFFFLPTDVHIHTTISFQGTYTIRWVLRNPEKPETSSERCCFTTKIKLTK